ncbi:hypothetical protein [Bradyrhizobium sp. AUGA SZCCT0160]|uniref:hypothetical protein n=1 Tax=Bradyrhizobium sp. AUGA SZCCT0160 TaxID=2807662 RepID=UPI001BAE498D|nr:hypothetical protein [Bradyrhizobium sp. AUGA SZCCT0160]MBR1193968.1 hypothetical protein [Bradyrhizobium sp. AUGA SZCCT0160]
MPSLIDQLDQALERSRSTTAAQSLGISELIRGALRETGSYAHYPVGMSEPSYVTRKEPAVVGSFRMTDVFPAPTGELVRQLDIGSSHRTAGNIYTIASAVFNSSRVLQAGARLVPIKDAPAPVQRDGVTAFYRRPAEFKVVTAPAMSVVTDGADVTVSPLPVASASIDFPDAPSHAISFKLSRRERKDNDEADTEYIVARALTLGLARLCDAVVLNAIVVAAPAPFSLAAAAARGLRFGELAAIAGRLATGATVAQDGTLRVAGIRAELTDVVDESVVACWSRIGVACEDECRVIVRRTNTNGDMEITMFTNLAAMLPTADYWLAA